MASKKREGKCENCGEIKTISVNYGKEVCSMCANLRVNIKKRPGVVLRSLAELAPEAVSELTDVQTLEATIADQRKELEQLREKLSTAQIIQEPAAVTTGSSFAKLELAYRLAVGMIKGEVEGVAVEDLELIRW